MFSEYEFYIKLNFQTLSKTGTLLDDWTVRTVAHVGHTLKRERYDGWTLLDTTRRDVEVRWGDRRAVWRVEWSDQRVMETGGWFR